MTIIICNCGEELDIDIDKHPIGKPFVCLNCGAEYFRRRTGKEMD